MTTSSIEKTEQLSQLYRLLYNNNQPDRYKVTAEIDMQDTSWRGVGVSPRFRSHPRVGGTGG